MKLLEMKTTHVQMALIVLLLLYVLRSNDSESNYEKSWSMIDKTALITGLDSTLSVTMRETEQLTQEQWGWKKDSSSLSVAQIIKHLTINDQLYLKEFQVLSQLPYMAQIHEANFSSDDAILSTNETTNPIPDQSPSYFTLKKWCLKKDALFSYKEVRNNLIEAIETSNRDLRKYYTINDQGPTDFYDLHQLILVNIAHTIKHQDMILQIKLDKDFPRLR